MKDLFLSKDILDGYFRDLVERLYHQDGLSDSCDTYPNPDVWCPIGTSGREVCYEMFGFLPDCLKSKIAIVDIRLNRGLSGGVSFHNSDSGEQLTEAEIKSYFAGKTVLLIDGLVYSGGTLKEAYRAAQRYEPKAIISYSTVVRVSSLFIPNYFSVLVGKHDRAHLHFKDGQTIPNKRLDGLGSVRLLMPSEDSSQILPAPLTGEAQFKTWHDIFSFCRNAKNSCFVYEKGNVIQAYVVFEINDEKSALLIKTLIVGGDYIGNYISGNLMRWMETYADANYLNQTRIWVASEDYDFYEGLGYRFPEARPDKLSGTIMVKDIPYHLPYGHRA